MLMSFSREQTPPYPWLDNKLREDAVMGDEESLPIWLFWLNIFIFVNIWWREAGWLSYFLAFLYFFFNFTGML